MPDNTLIMVVDDEAEYAENMQLLLQGWGYEVAVRRGARDTMDYLRSAEPKPDVLVLDFELGENDTGLDLWEKTRAMGLCLPAVVISNKADDRHKKMIADAGALYWYKLGGDPDQLRGMVGEHARTNRQQKRRWEEDIANNMLVGDLSAVRERIGKFAPSEANALIVGDTGTGKELVARNIHLLSQRRYAPFVATNCGAIPEHLVESELFGHKKGSFTGAIADRDGKFVQADTGTIFLDEVTEMKRDLQVKLLRAIEAHEIQPVGSNETLKVNVRVISATNRDLQACVANGEFREDLYYRLNVLRIRLPSLRERKSDIPALVQCFMSRISRDNHQPAPDISADCMSRLMEHDWLGNVRELRNALEKAMILSGGRQLTPEHLELDDSRLQKPIRQEEFWKQGTLADAADKAQALRLAYDLGRLHGNKTAVAKLHGYTRAGLNGLIKRLLDNGHHELEKWRPREREDTESQDDQTP